MLKERIFHVESDTTVPKHFDAANSVCEQATKSMLRNDGNTSKSKSQLEEHWSSILPNDPFLHQAAPYLYLAS